ncbi:hypothetical protein POKO110462_00955 [Pontibacter korlensis]|uniref:STAS/SEC14 domain-containing protein n=1 Tax=Pontibacter korlensis TaxID=400092 RepID=A0A0E3UWM3_9BACT|nr:hypothetical protein [Pontibacter korlensis]AKD02831.1 hypothetical protein PKOR_06445 [Pontibacter korlensis]
MYSTEKDTTQEQTGTLVAQNQCYKILYAPHQNRLYLSIHGFWKNKNAVPEYLPDLKRALLLVKPDFTLLLDTRTMITHPQAVMSLHVEAQTLLREAGMKKAACVDPADRIATLQLEDTFSQSRFSSRHFTSYAEAEAWLNE